LCLCGFLALLVYLNSLPNDFVVDDRPQIVDNAFLRRPDGLRKIFTTDVWAFFGQEVAGSYYRPLMHSAFYAGWRLFHQNATGYRAVNLLLHACISMLLFWWLRRLRATEGVAGVAAALFAVHPVHVEAVAWISALPDLLCSLFFLLGFTLYLAGWSMCGWRKGLAGAGLGACVLLGLLAKETGIVLPVMLGLYAVAEHGGTAGGTPAVLRRGAASGAPTWAAMAVAIGLYLALRWHALGTLIPVLRGPRLPLQLELAGWLAMLYEYTIRVVAPVRFSAFHRLEYPVSVFGWRTAAGLAIACALVALAAWLRRHGRLEWLAAALFLVALLPCFPGSRYPNGYELGDRYLYLPSAGFCWLLAVAIARLQDNRLSAFGFRPAGFRPPTADSRQPILLRGLVVPGMVLVVVVGAYAARTMTFNRAWRDEVSFYQRILSQEREAPRIRPLLVEAFIRRGAPERALEHAQAMVRLEPRDARSHNALGFVYWALGQPEQAVAEYRRAVECARAGDRPDFAARALNNLAVVCSQAGRMDLAMPAYQEAVRLDPGFSDGRMNLGSALFAMGRMGEAEEHLRAAIRLNPSAPLAYSTLALVLAARQNFPAARQAVAQALRIEPDNAETLARAGEMALQAGDAAEARRLFSRAAALDPANARARAGIERIGHR
jgi:tetratricopeptide (TPR) repeat protein